MALTRLARPRRGRCLAIFVLVGPPVAWLVVFAEALLFADELRLSGEIMQNAVMSFLYFSAFGFSLSYLFGALPALIGGYVYWRLRHTVTAAHSGRLMAPIGAAVGLIAPVTIAHAVGAELPAVFSQWQYFLLPGAAAGFASARVVEIGLERS